MGTGIYVERAMGSEAVKEPEVTVSDWVWGGDEACMKWCRQGFYRERSC